LAIVIPDSFCWFFEKGEKYLKISGLLRAFEVSLLSHKAGYIPCNDVPELLIGVLEKFYHNFLVLRKVFGEPVFMASDELD
jgi:hypothetical protein